MENLAHLIYDPQLNSIQKMCRFFLSFIAFADVYRSIWYFAILCLFFVCAIWIYFNSLQMRTLYHSIKPIFGI